MDYGCGPSSALVAITDRCEVYGDDEDYENQEVMKMVTIKGMEMEMFKLIDMFVFLNSSLTYGE